MKISDFIFKFKSFRMRREGLCRVRIFINSEKEKICVLTDINNMSNMHMLSHVIFMCYMMNLIIVCL